MTLLNSISKGAIKGAAYGSVVAVGVAGFGLFASRRVLQGEHPEANLLNSMLFLALPYCIAPLILIGSVLLEATKAGVSHDSSETNETTFNQASM